MNLSTEISELRLHFDALHALTDLDLLDADSMRAALRLMREQVNKIEMRTAGYVSLPSPITAPAIAAATRPRRHLTLIEGGNHV